MISFKQGDSVQVHKKTKAGDVFLPGEVVEVVEKGQYPATKGAPGFKGFNKGKQASRRDHESYVVKVARELLWPRVGQLQAASAGVAPTAAPSYTNTTMTKETRPDGTVVETVVTVTGPAVTVTKAPEPLKAPELETDFVILLDSSGSMETLRDATIRAFNAEVEAIKIEAGKAGLREPRVSLWMFGENNGIVRRHMHRQPVSQLKPLALKDYVPSGGTPMFSCIRQAIDAMMAEPAVAANPNLSVVLHVITDGQATDRDRIYDAAAALGETKATGRWTHAFMVPAGVYKRNFMSSFGLVVTDGNVLEWDASEKGVAAAASVTTSAVNAYMVSRSAGVKSVTNFFQPDLSKLTASDLAQLTDLSASFKLYDVKQELNVKDFIEGVTGQPYVIGSAYYQLMKTEKEVQPQKNILLRDRASGRIYGGIQARRVIGLPFDRTVKIEPGNHAGFDIFIESTSVNRALPRGTKVLHDWSQKIDKMPTWNHLAVQVSP